MFSFDNKLVIYNSPPILYPFGISLTIKRLDTIDHVYGGNKWFKLKQNLDLMKNGGYSKLLTFGGAWSNHISAVARIGKLEGIQTTGIIRGEKPAGLNTTLERALKDGMNLLFVSRSDYNRKSDPAYLKSIVADFQNYYVIPEGGSNLAGVTGCKDILNESDNEFDQVAVACGTGATAAGIILSLKKHQHLTGISVLKDGGSMEIAISSYLQQSGSVETYTNWHIEHDYHFGGYAKSNKTLERFIASFIDKNRITVEPVYTGKLFYALDELIVCGKFKSGSKILAIHTGGLQYLLEE